MGANAILGVSMAILKAGAAAKVSLGSWPLLELAVLRLIRPKAWFPLKIAVAFASGHRLAAQRYFAAPPTSGAADSEVERFH